MTNYDEDKMEEIFNKAMELYDNCKWEKAIKKFKLLLENEVYEYVTIAAYKIGSCYAFLENYKYAAFYFEDAAIRAGANDY
jgi:hypothetical protein